MRWPPAIPRGLAASTSLAIMLLDVLSELAELKICTAYELDGRRSTDFPSHVDDLRRVVPVYETMPGWQQAISGATGSTSCRPMPASLSSGSAS